MLIDNQEVMSNRIVLNTAPAGEKGVQFDRDEILKGVVQGIKPDGTISLLIKDKLVDAVSEVKANPGQSLYLSVDGFKNGLTYLKIIMVQGTTRIEDNPAGLRVLSDADTLLIIRKLLQHNLPVTRQNITETFKAMNLVGDITARNLEVAVFALKHSIPLDRNILPLISQFISSDGNLPRLVQELVQLLVQMETMARSTAASSAAASSATPPAATSAGASSPANAAPNPAGVGGEATSIPNTASSPSTPPSVATTSTPGPTGTGGETNLVPGAVLLTTGHGGNPAAPGNTVNAGQQVAAPSQFAVSAEGSPSQFAVSAEGSAGQNQNIATLPGAAASGAVGGETGSANNPSVVPGPAPAATGDIGASAAASDTVPKNTVITAAPTQTSKTVYQPPVNPVAVSPDFAAAKETKPFDLTEFAKILRMVLESAVGRMAGSGHGVNPVLQSLIKERTLLLDNLRGLLEMVKANEMLAKTHVGQELLTKISNLQQQITGQSLFNSAVKLNPDIFTNNYYFSFPVEIDNQLTYCQLRIQKNTGNRLGQQDNIKLVVSLDTQALGIVMFHIDWYRHGYIQLQGVVETAEAGGFIEENIAELLFSLNELGYRANNLGIKVTSDPEELVLKPLIKETEQDKIGPFSIDVVA